MTILRNSVQAFDNQWFYVTSANLTVDIWVLIFWGTWLILSCHIRSDWEAEHHQCLIIVYFQYTFHLKNINSKINHFTCSKKSYKLIKKKKKKVSVFHSLKLISFSFPVAGFCCFYIVTFQTNNSQHKISQALSLTCFHSHLSTAENNNVEYTWC